MKKRTQLRVLAAVALGSVLVLSLSSRSTSASGHSVAEGASCVTYRADVRARAYGYDHWVLLDSTCTKTADCQVGSDVRTDPVAVAIAPGAHEEVNLWLGSPASSFTPSVKCKLRENVSKKGHERSE